MRALLALVVAGLALRGVLILRTDGGTFDLESFRIVVDALERAPLDLYAQTRVDAAVADRWPYGPGYLPALLVVDALSQSIGLSFDRLVRVVPALADVALALLVWATLRERAARTALVAAALVLLGPSFVANSSAHGQLDSVAVLSPAVAVVLWQRGVPRRWLWCGLLIGLGAATKSPMGIFLLALLPTAVSRSEAARLAGAAVAVPVVALMPWLISDAPNVFHALSYRGLPGLGGLSLLVQPELAANWLTGEPRRLTALSRTLQDANGVLVIAGIGIAGVVLARLRAQADQAACILALVLWFVGVNFALGYAVWGLAFLLLAGRVRAAALVQLVLLAPIVMVYAGPAEGWSSPAVYAVFVPCMLALLAGSGLALARASMAARGAR